MNERGKIIEILKQTSDLWKDEEYHGYITSVDIGEIAAALIAANIGDVTAHEAEAEYWKTICKIESDEHNTTIKNAAEHARHLMQERDEWKERAEKAERRLKSAKQKPRKTNIYYGTARLEHLNGDPHEILCPYCGENIKFHVSDTCPYCNALLFKKTSRGAKDKYSDILQLKSFCERNGIKCTLTRRIEDFNGKLKDRDGYKITFLNGDVIQCADTNGYFEFYNCHNEVDGKWIGLQRAKSFVLRYKNWLDLNNKPNANKEEEKGE